MHEVRVTVNPDGTTKTDFSGFTGPTCLDEAAKLRQLLANRFGIQVEETNFVAKPELQQAQEQQQRQREGQQQ
jgi:hypothetical protein